VDTLGQFLYALILFLMVLFLAWFSTRLLGQHWGAPRRGRALAMLEQIPAGRDRSIALVEVAGRVYLVGITPEAITLLDLITDPAVVADVRAAAAPPHRPPFPGALSASFPSLLRRVQGRPAENLPAGAPASSSLEEQLRRLRELSQAKK
jgi:flagellar biosynthetic protein FliO